jgi:putative sigma-54 modulation protein
MRVTVTFRHIEATDALRRYAETKIRRVVSKYFHRPLEGHVVLAVSKRRHSAEISVAADRTMLNAHEETGDLYSAIDLAVDKIERQAKKRKAKRKGHKAFAPPRAAATGNAVRSRPVEVAQTDAEEPPTVPVVRTERLTAKPMTVEEAMLQLDMSTREFLVFRNATSEALNVIYRRRDGDYGLIEPIVHPR